MQRTLPHNVANRVIARAVFEGIFPRGGPR